MCGRFVTASSPALIADRFAVDEVDATVTPDPEPDYNVSPRRNVLVVREQAREEGKPQRVLSSAVRPRPNPNPVTARSR